MDKSNCVGTRRPTSQRHPIAVAAVLMCGLLGASGGVHAQSIEDKLRTQLRTTTQDLRQMQDAQAQLQADKSAAEQQRDKALADLKQAQNELAAAREKSGAQVAAERALSAERTGHAQDVQQLAKSRESYQELLAASRTRDAERAQAQTELKARDAQLQRCMAQNAQLDQVGHDILDAYEHMGLGTLLGARQPFAQSARVKYDEIAQRYGDALRAGRFDPAGVASVPTPASAAASAASAAK